mmetsp:Transcript_24866/g.72871  ORF Transcript_24866/g.72871 Transcript_24866/m.72871 type:complete len:207 (-) Transcript_24866:54-674(-)
MSRRWSSSAVLSSVSVAGAESRGSGWLLFSRPTRKERDADATVKESSAATAFSLRPSRRTSAVDGASSSSFSRPRDRVDARSAAECRRSSAGGESCVVTPSECRPSSGRVDAAGWIFSPPVSSPPTASPTASPPPAPEEGRRTSEDRDVDADAAVDAVDDEEEGRRASIWSTSTPVMIVLQRFSLPSFWLPTFLYFRRTPTDQKRS